jgi:hypothetical protein
MKLFILVCKQIFDYCKRERFLRERMEAIVNNHLHAQMWAVSLKKKKHSVV